MPFKKRTCSLYEQIKQARGGLTVHQAHSDSEICALQTFKNFRMLLINAILNSEVEKHRICGFPRLIVLFAGLLPERLGHSPSG